MITFIRQWGRGEPNDINTENCVHIYKRKNFYFNDEKCRNKIWFICERLDSKLPGSLALKQRPHRAGLYSTGI